MSIKKNELEAIVEDIIDGIKDEFQTHFDSDTELAYALQYLQTKVEEMDVEDF